MHYDEQRENDIKNNSAKKSKATFPHSPSINQHINITWHFDEVVKNDCADLVKKPKGNV